MIMNNMLTAKKILYYEKYYDNEYFTKEKFFL